MAIGAIAQGDLVLIRHETQQFSVFGLFLVTASNPQAGTIAVRPISDLPLIRSWPVTIPVAAVSAVYSASSTA